MDLSSLFKNRTGKPITYQEAHDELLEAYDEAIEHFVGNDHVGISDFEDPLNGSLYQLWLDTYIREQIGERFHLSFDEFLDRPRWEIGMMLSTLQRLRTAVQNAMNKGKTEAEQLEKHLRESQ